MSETTGGAVYLSNVDDFVNPSQACVNPVFNGSDTAAQNGPSSYKDKDDPSIPQPDKVVLRKRGKERTNEIVTATIADCLACSGCVTTAETVLMEERHNLEKLSTAQQPIVFTISPAALADWRRQFGHSGETWAAIWRKYLNVWAVIDGNLPLQWSRSAAVKEFVDAYKKQQQNGPNNDSEKPYLSQHEILEQKGLPSRALSQRQSEFWLHDGTTTIIDEIPLPRAMQQLPLVTSSCPAIVCYVEKSNHELVGHLSTAASPIMSVCDTSQQFFHVAIQPCHDKKLESNRLDFSEQGVDLVLTTMELLEYMNCTFPEVNDWSAIASKQSPVDTKTFESRVELSAFLSNLKDDSKPAYCLPKAELATISVSSSEPFVAGSGGYADTVFRCAAYDLFGVQVVPKWEPVASTTRRGRGRAPKRDFYAASLYQMPDGSFSTTISTNANLVWKFGIAYGLQTVQRIFADLSSYQYVEAMACAGSCLNGAGQFRLGNPETPSETRERLDASKEHFSICRPPQLASNHDLVHTRFHMVPAMRHSMGLAAGVSIEDTRW